jgi:Cu2+-exporting ATPase/Cu+-exporting ATPase
MTLTRTLSRASKLGIIIKNDEVIEKLSNITSVFFDKTGTLTYGVLKVNQFNVLKSPHLPLYEMINSLEKYSTHPVAIALKEYSFEQGTRTLHPVENYKELMGIGVEGIINGHLYEIKNGKIFEDKICIAEFTLEDHIRADSKKSVEELILEGIDVKILSGDHREVVHSIATQAGINKENALAELSPEEKLSMIEKNQEALMVGDGANDAMALSRSFVSVAVLGSLDISLRSADIYLTTPGISHVSRLIILSKEVMKVIKRNLVLSLFYNVISVYGAFTGTITPLVAAIVMPVSSLTILASTLLGTKKLNTLLKNSKGH